MTNKSWILFPGAILLALEKTDLWRNQRYNETPVPLPGKFHGWRSLVGYSPWGRKELDMTERNN